MYHVKSSKPGHNARGLKRTLTQPGRLSSRNMSKLGGVTEEGTVVSNLPLLFADGRPTSLEKITEKQLEKFIVLMLNCSASREYFCNDNMPTPKWWPNDIPFKIPLVKPDDVGDEWIWKLKSLVTRCYAYHACDFMLTFCHDLAKYPVDVLKFVDLCDGTTSLVNKQNGKLLVTFRNQNVIYDRKVDCSPRKYLLPRGGKGSGGPKPMVQSPPFIDIYLCDGCDAEFETLNEVSEHERLCRREQQDQPQSLRSTTPDDLLGLGDDQSMFLNYFSLGECGDGECSPSLASPPRPKPFKRRCQGNVSFIRCCTVPFSSPLGISLQKKMPRATYVVAQAHLDRVERYCLPVKQNPRISWSHLYRSAQKKSPPDWAHSYSFNKRQRLAKYEALQVGLSERSIRLLKICPRLEVSLTRLSEEDIVGLMKRNAKKSVSTSKPLSASLQEVQPIVCHSQVDIPVIDLCSSDDEDSGISSFINSPSPKIATVSVNEQSHKIEDSCSSQLNYFQSVMITNTLPIKYSSSSFTASNLNKPISLRKRWRRGRKSLASENETIPATRERKKLSRNHFPVHNEAKSKLQELNQIKESNDTKSKEWYPQFISSNQANHDGKKYSTAV